MKNCPRCQKSLTLEQAKTYCPFCGKLFSKAKQYREFFFVDRKTFNQGALLLTILAGVVLLPQLSEIFSHGSGRVLNTYTEAVKIGPLHKTLYWASLTSDRRPFFEITVSPEVFDKLEQMSGHPILSKTMLLPVYRIENQSDWLDYYTVSLISLLVAGVLWIIGRVIL